MPIHDSWEVLQQGIALKPLVISGAASDPPHLVVHHASVHTLADDYALTSMGDAKRRRQPGHQGIRWRMMCSGNEGTKEENQLGVVNCMRGCGGLGQCKAGCFVMSPANMYASGNRFEAAKHRCAARLEITATLEEINQGVVRVQLKETHTPNPAGAVPPPAGAVIHKNEAMIIRVRQEVWMREIARRTFTTWLHDTIRNDRTEGFRVARFLMQHVPQDVVRHM